MADVPAATGVPREDGAAPATDVQAQASAPPAYVVVSEPRPGRVLLEPLDADGAPVGSAAELARPDLAAAVAEHERDRPRWVWNDTQRWYPTLLAENVRVDRCVDLRLCHTILRTSALTAHSTLATSPASAWDTLRPAGAPAPTSAAPLKAAPLSLFDDLFLTDDDPVPPSSRHKSPYERSERAVFDGSMGEGDGDGKREGGGAGAGAAPDERREFALQRDAIATALDPSRIALLVAAESVGALAAAELRHAGLPWSATRHDALLTRVLGPRPRDGERPAELERLLQRIRSLLNDPTVNPDSPVELLKALRRAGITVDSTREWELKTVQHPAIEPLLDYKKRSRLLTANGWNWLDTWVVDGRFHANYLPGGVVTGRWAAEGGGALQLPKQVRSAVVADEGRMLVVADAAQLEPRILAALAGDRAMAAAGRGRDLYDGIVASGAVDTRAHAKLGMLGAMYGGTAGESGRMLPRLARAFPAAVAYVEAAARTGETGGVVSTRLGRTSPHPSAEWRDLHELAASDGATDALRTRARTEARSWGRFTRNFVVQGTAAEWALCWIGSIRRRLHSLGRRDGAAALTDEPHLSFFLHDEVMVHTPAHLAEAVAHELREAAAEAGRLIFGDAPVEFPVTVAIVDSYDQAK
ncbi:bifunctional 3'-5' exonuclease/DNA polymerase [Herbiconiux sp. CPCC 205716]|uniref:DNA-directed DNA polymerase n=1 Tax=Herbiconiux gentiana TaxID=2970912 RepID=A0ABT2GC56_9MICO|nr:bifunctional 3'-5' exonuclease/DNA polymerase [Herbiconiux gentiana]MCS5713788.1 bifunctional 3'-5' exonuclease/DNA polymerase [Herbiconiux gentiana]